jgi:hypothetical protein
METRSLVRKLAEVMAAVERIPKRGRNDFHKYDYATEADIAATVREELAKRSVMLIPSITGEARHPVGDKGSVLTVLEMEMSFHDGESGERLDYPWRGYGTDKEDKGGYKAMTGGEKYFLLKTFLMPTGDDPEHDDRKPVARQPEARRPMPAQAPQPRPAAAATGGPVISEGQAKRFFAIARGVGWSNDEIKAFLKKQLNIETSAQIPLAQYERICKAVETGEVVNA